MRPIFYLYLYALIILAIFTDCGKSSKIEDNETTDSTALIRITKAQFESDSMKIGEVSIQTFQEEVKCTGYIMAPVNGIAEVSAPIAGIVESIKCVVGDHVKKGQVICTMSSLDLIMVQQDYFEAVTKLSNLKSEYDRIKALYDEKIGSEKEFLAAESEYKSIQAKYQALKMYLRKLNLDLAEIEDGKMFGEFPVTSPISGFITSLNIILGKYIEQQVFLFEIVDADQFQLQLHIFEKDIYKLKEGQRVKFGRSEQKIMEDKATITSIGKAIDPETMSILCTAMICKEDNPVADYINHAYIEARVEVDKVEARGLPSDAILKEGKDQVILLVEKIDSSSYYLRAEKVTTGRTYNGFTEIINPEITGKIIIKGVYNIRTI